MPPAMAPKQKGTSTEETAKMPPRLRRTPCRTTAFRKAKLAPRRTMPRAARVRGTNMVKVIDA